VAHSFEKKMNNTGEKVWEKRKNQDAPCYHGCFLGYKDSRQCTSSNEIVFQSNLCFPNYAFMKHCLERQVCNKMKGKGSFHFIVTALEFLIRLSVAFCFLVGILFL